MVSMEMSRYSQLENTYEEYTLWELYEGAAKHQFGHSIRVLKTPWARQQVNDLSFELSIESSDSEPRETRRTIVDVNTKEFTNLSEKETDETTIKIKKIASDLADTRYTFSTATGLVWGMGENIGAQVMRLAIAGGSVWVSMSFKQRSAVDVSDTFEFSYNQEERILIPPMSQVKAKVTTYLKKYEQGYALKFSLPSSLRIPVTYKTKCQQMFCGSNSRTISAAQLCATLPHFQVADGKVSFIQTGTLSWISEGSTIHKEVQLLGQN